MITPADMARQVVDHLESFTYRWSTEVELQDAMWDVLCARFSDCVREVRLSAHERPDFLIDLTGPATVAVEVKVKGSHNAVVRQLGRYAAHDHVDAVVLASGRRTLIAGMPAQIHGKPIASAFLAVAL